MSQPLAACRVLPDGLDRRFELLGVAIVEHALTAHDIERVERAFPEIPAGTGGVRTADFAPGHVGAIAAVEPLQALADRLGGCTMSIARVLALDKNATSNWFVPWHQDRTDNRQERPEPVLMRMVTLRVHLDDCGADDGPLEVLPGSHRDGRLERDVIARLARESEPLLCLAVRGDILAMRPLLVHRSQMARVPERRRVIHIEYTPALDA